MLTFLLRDVVELIEIVEPAGDGGTVVGIPPMRAFAIDIWAAVMPAPARGAGRARAAFWRAVAAVLRAPVGWRREGPDMAPEGGGW